MKEWWNQNHDMLEAYFWVIMAVPTLLWWKDVVLWVALMSLYANAKTAHSAHKAERAKQEVRRANEEA
jgi:hypothetical protein